MDVTNTTNTTTTTSIKTPEAESETPTRIQPAKPVTVNGLLRRHQPITQPPPFSYAECQKNHAAGMGGHAVDGCGEFMSSVSSNPNDPSSLRCAACGCHRNFHRRETNQPTNNHNQAMIEYQPAHRYNPPPPPPRADSPSSPSPPPISSAYYPASAPHMLLALSSGVSGAQPHSAPHVGHHIPNGKKRFRTKFTHEQKEKMLEFANKIGWKIQRRDEAEIAAFCNEIGVDRNVLKVWMHNNKSTLGKRHRSNENGSSGSEDGAAAAAEDEEEQTHHHHHHNNVDVNATANGTGSSTSS